MLPATLNKRKVRYAYLRVWDKADKGGGSVKGAMSLINERTQETEKLVSPFFFFKCIHSILLHQVLIAARGLWSAGAQ